MYLDKPCPRHTELILEGYASMPWCPEHEQSLWDIQYMIFERWSGYKIIKPNVQRGGGVWILSVFTSFLHVWPNHKTKSSFMNLKCSCLKSGYKSKMYGHFMLLHINIKIGAITLKLFIDNKIKYFLFHILTKMLLIAFVNNSYSCRAAQKDPNYCHTKKGWVGHHPSFGVTKTEPFGVPSQTPRV